ncbi:multivesicular body subunit 12B isoform X1 [Octopus bimaculoides]|uniref:multivesicular body subunit 12B isoform X1 n=3 Tax=Octopus bimaculoides TaxID=37653 RepID=UPI0022E42EF0|nr:multivesicular body subunit 12B isoform X1 [Octopus bimaculoides]
MARPHKIQKVGQTMYTVNKITSPLLFTFFLPPTPFMQTLLDRVNLCSKLVHQSYSLPTSFMEPAVKLIRVKSSSMTDDNSDQPIVAVCVVSDRLKCPPKYFLLDRTEDGKDDADLWRDSLFGRRYYRYICYKKCNPMPDDDVLVDVAIINDKDSVPAGFTVLEYTEDTHEKSLKKKSLCFRWMSYRLTNAAISKLILLSKSMRRPPSGYTVIGDINNMLLCFKMVSLAKTNMNYSRSDEISTHHILTATTSQSRLCLTPVENALPYVMNPTMAASNPNLSSYSSSDDNISRLVTNTKSRKYSKEPIFVWRCVT